MGEKVISRIQSPRRRTEQNVVDYGPERLARLLADGARPYEQMTEAEHCMEGAEWAEVGPRGLGTLKADRLH
jgi:hypothetical protein